MNLYPFNNFTLMLDYAHNPHGIAALGEFLKNMQASKLVGVIAGIGDRRNEDIIACGEQAAKIFDEIIIRMDEDLRGRTEFEISSLLLQGIHKVAPESRSIIFQISRNPSNLRSSTPCPVRWWWCWLIIFQKPQRKSPSSRKSKSIR